MNKNLSFGIIGLVIGLAIGFFLANNLNQKQMSVVSNDSGLVSDQTGERQVRNEIVKDQSNEAPIMPEIAQTLDKATSEPENFDAQIAAGDLFLKIRNFQKANEYFEAASMIKPADYETIVKIGNTYFDAGQFEKAADWYEKALQKKPEDFNVRTDLGVTFVERPAPQISRAISEFELSLKTNPRHEPTLYNLGAAYYRSGDLDRARQISNTLGEINPKSDANAKLKELLK